MASTNFEIHAPHWHGNTVTINGMRTDVSNMVSMGMRVAEMVPDNPGIWPFHCHRLNHIANDSIYPGGMLTFLRYLDWNTGEEEEDFFDDLKE